jgi:hypothetical protein
MQYRCVITRLAFFFILFCHDVPSAHSQEVIFKITASETGDFVDVDFTSVPAGAIIIIESKTGTKQVPTKTPTTPVSIPKGGPYKFTFKLDGFKEEIVEFENIMEDMTVHRKLTKAQIYSECPQVIICSCPDYLQRPQVFVRTRLFFRRAIQVLESRPFDPCAAPMLLTTDKRGQLVGSR